MVLDALKIVFSRKIIVSSTLASKLNCLMFWLVVACGELWFP